MQSSYILDSIIIQNSIPSAEKKTAFNNPFRSDYNSNSNFNNPFRSASKNTANENINPNLVDPGLRKTISMQVAGPVIFFPFLLRF